MLAKLPVISTFCIISALRTENSELSDDSLFLAYCVVAQKFLREEVNFFERLQQLMDIGAIKRPSGGDLRVSPGILFQSNGDCTAIFEVF